MTEPLTAADITMSQPRLATPPPMSVDPSDRRAMADLAKRATRSRLYIPTITQEKVDEVFDGLGITDETRDRYRRMREDRCNA